MDELTHDAYWKEMNFKDPCSVEDAKSFRLCPFECPIEKHDDKCESRSYCNQPLWHETNAAAQNAAVKSSGGGKTMSRDGHVFDCVHGGTYNVIFVADESGSMKGQDQRPQSRQISLKFPNRLGCVFESCDAFLRCRSRNQSSPSANNDRVSMVLFSTSATTVYQGESLSRTDLLDTMLMQRPAYGGTCFSSGLNQAMGVLDATHTDDAQDVIIFLSDGGDSSSTQAVARVRALCRKYPSKYYRFRIETYHQYQHHHNYHQPSPWPLP